MPNAPLLSVADALARILAGADPMETEAVGLLDADGRVLAGPLTARRTQPPFDVSAMDGFAIRAADAATLPAELRIIGEAAAGHGFRGAVAPGEAVRIFTGAPVPEGADAIVIQENTEFDGATVRIVDGTLIPFEAAYGLQVHELVVLPAIEELGLDLLQSLPGCGPVGSRVLAGDRKGRIGEGADCDDAAVFPVQRVAEPIEPAELIARWASQPLDFDPGTQYQYSNTGYVLMGMIADTLAMAVVGIALIFLPAILKKLGIDL